MSKGISWHFEGTKGSGKAETSRVALIEEKLLKRDKLKEPDFYVGAKGGILLAKYKKWIGVSRRDRLLKKAKNSMLKNAVDQLYRPGAVIGDGGTASVLKFEKATGLGMGKGGKPHIKKAEYTIKYLKRIMSTQNLSDTDRKLATKLRNDLIKALGGFKK